MTADQFTFMEMQTTPDKPLFTVKFTVRDPVTLNATYVRRGNWRPGTKGLALSNEARDFKARVAEQGMLAKQNFLWPQLDQIRRAELSMQLYDFKGDADGPRKSLRDALEGVLYLNDKIVQDGRSPLPIFDGKGKRVEITVDILEVGPLPKPKSKPKRKAK